MPRLICHLDMNSYFASVEQQANPFLRGRAVGVCAYLHPSTRFVRSGFNRYGCVIAASVEAKQMGMKVGMTMEQAKEAVPSAVFVQNDPPKYRAVSSRLFRLLNELTDAVEIYSIDEAFLDLTGWFRDAAEAAFAFSRIKWRLREEVGEWLRCSVGIASTRFLAKFASDLKKPDGLTVLTPENLDYHLAIADLEDAWGIGPRFRRQLERLGIKTLLDLKRYPVANLLAVMGKPGYFLWANVNGLEVASVKHEEPLPKTIGHSYCVPNRVNRDGTVEAVLTRLVERAGRRLRSHELCAGRMEVAVGVTSPYPSFVRRGRTAPFSPYEGETQRGSGGIIDHRFPIPVDDPSSLVGTAAELLHQVWHGEPVDFLAVTLSEFSIKTEQLRLTDIGYQPKPGRLSSSIDRIRDKHGEEAVVFGRMFKLLGKDEAPDRIGYRKTEGNGWENVM